MLAGFSPSILNYSVPLLHAISTLGCPDLPLDDVATLLRAHGLDAAEVRCVAGTLDLPTYFAATYGTGENLAAHLRSLDLTLVSLDTSFQLIGSTPAQREEFLRFVPWAEALGLRWLRVFDGGKAGTDAEFAEAAATHRWWRDLRQANGWTVDVMVETHDLLFTSALIDRFLADAPGAALLWDSHHTWRRGREDPVATWSAIHAHVVHLHVKDSIEVPSDRHPFTYVLPGEGQFPIAPLLARLNEDRYSGYVTLEWEKRWHPYLPPLETALAQATRIGWW